MEGATHAIFFASGLSFNLCEILDSLGWRRIKVLCFSFRYLPSALVVLVIAQDYKLDRRHQMNRCTRMNIHD
jgi:hypothetical protein